MNKIVLIAAFIGFFLCSCRNESVDLENGSTSSNVYLPLNSGNFWTYKVIGARTNRDSLYVQKDTVIDAIEYKKMKTKVFPTGFFCVGLNGNSIRKSNDKILLSGKANLGFIPTLSLNVQLTDYVTFKEVTNADEQIDSKTGIIEQTISGFPLKIEYTLKSIGLAPLVGFTTPEGKTYADVKPIKLIVTAKITATTTIGGVPINIPILNPQDVVTSTQYFAKNKGMVYAKTVVSYQLQTLPAGIILDFPTSTNQTQEEFLDTFLIN